MTWDEDGHRSPQVATPNMGGNDARRKHRTLGQAPIISDARAQLHERKTRGAMHRLRYPWASPYGGWILTKADQHSTRYQQWQLPRPATNSDRTAL